MANDTKLEQLKIAQERAFTKKQQAYQNQQNSWKILSDTREEMNKAFETKQSAFSSQERAWQDYRSVSDRNSPRIESLNATQERAYQNMKNAFDQASSAHSNHDGASAKSYATEGHGYKAEAQRCVEERRRLVEECKSARARYEPYKQIFESSKVTFGRAKDEYEKAKVAHERTNAEFKHAKTDFDIAAKAFQTRLSELRLENTKRKENNRAIASKAGVPYRYRDNAYVSKDPDGTVNIFFGGFGTPDGPGHGHYAMDSYGNIAYKREPLNPHGHKNFTDNKENQFGNGEVFGGKFSTAPVHGATATNKDVTVSFGLGKHDGETYISDGHIQKSSDFWGQKNQKGHDHYGPDGQSYADRDKYHD